MYFAGRYSTYVWLSITALSSLCFISVFDLDPYILSLYNVIVHDLSTSTDRIFEAIMVFYQFCTDHVTSQLVVATAGRACIS